MTGGWIPIIIVAAVVLLIVIIVAVVLVWRARRKAVPAGAAPAAIRPSELAPPAELSTAIAIAMRELRILVAGGRGPVEVPWALVVGAGGEDLAALLPPPMEQQHEISWIDDQRLRTVGTVSFRAGGVVVGFDDGLVGVPQSDGRLRDLLHEIEVVRPLRPIDSLTIVIPWAFLALIEDDEAGRDRIAARGRALYDIILAVQQRTGWRVPVYVLISETQQLPGFSALAKAVIAHSDDPMIGWPAPKALDSAFDLGWVDEAFGALDQSLSVQQFHVLMGIADDRISDDLVLLPGRLSAIKPILILLLKHMLQSSAYHEGFMLRGIFLTGDTMPPPLLAPAPSALQAPTPPTGSPAPRPPQPLAQTLFALKIFPESNLAQPAYGERTRRHRLIRRTQQALIAVAALFALAMMAIPYLGRQYLPPVEVLLTDIKDSTSRARKFRSLTRDVATKACIEGTDSDANRVTSDRIERDRQVSLDLLKSMSQLRINGVEAFLAPTSYLSDTNRKVETAIKASFRDVVFNAISESMATPVGIGQLVDRNTANRGIDAYWNTTVANIIAYDQNYRLAYALRDKSWLDPALVANFSRLVRYSLDEELPARFTANYDLYSRGIEDYPVPCLDSRMVRTTMKGVFEDRYKRTVEGYYLQNPISIAANSIARRFATFGPDLGVESELEQSDSGPSAIVTESPEARLKGLIDDIDTISGQLAFPRKYAWIYALGPERLPMPRVDALMSLDVIDRNFVAGLAGTNRPIAYAAAVRLREAALYNARLLTPDLATAVKTDTGKPTGDGAVASAPAGLPHLSPEIADTRSYLKALFAQSYLAAGPAQASYYDGARISWDRDVLALAENDAKSFTAFSGLQGGGTPGEIRDMAIEVARRHFANRVDQLLRQAARPPGASRNAALSPLQSEAMDFGRALPQLVNIRNALRLAKADDLAGQLDGRVVRQAGRLLAAGDRQLSGNGGPYAVDEAGLASWNGTGSLAAAAFGLDSIDDLKGSMDLRRKIVSDIARNLSAPLVAYLLDVETNPDADSASRAKRWQDILDTLQVYDQKSPDNSLSRLQDYITVGIDKIGLSDCGSGGGGRLRMLDYFALQQKAIAARLAARCRAVASGSSESQFARLRASFNERLAGRFPFASDRDATSADPADVKRFFAEFGDSLAPLKAALDADTSRDAQATSATLGQLIEVRDFLASMLATPGPSPLVYHIDVDFFTDEQGAQGQQQVIEASIGTALNRATTVPGGSTGFDWKSGQPISSTLRWAANASTIPSTVPPAPDGRCVPPPGGAIAAFRTRGDYWALLRFVRQQSAEGGDAGPPSLATGTPIRFVVKLCENRQRESGGDDVTAAAYIYARLKMSTTLPDRQAKVLQPDFPEAVPAWPRAAYRR